MESYHPHYFYVEKAIQYLKTHFRERPNLLEVSDHVGLSPFHFQRVFQEWAGISPKQFLHYIHLQEARTALRSQLNLLEATEQAGLSSAGRLHDLFIKIEKMSPGDYKNGAAGLLIHYEAIATRFGTLLIASTERGICQMDFIEDSSDREALIRVNFPNAILQQNHLHHHAQVKLYFDQALEKEEKITLHLKGTEFQFQVWQALLKIPEAECCSYQDISKALDKPNASRAVGTAIGSNLVALLIPCHRVIRSDQSLGGYKWGLTKKSALLSWEALHQK
jgi:AraC family transcriptional regulator of adaptative response/methylated-DNA-[protein]-cysteine methyltransferase